MTNNDGTRKPRSHHLRRYIPPKSEAADAGNYDKFAQSLAAGQARLDAITEGYEEIARADRERMSISSREDWLHDKGAEQKLKDAWKRAIRAREEQLQRLDTMTSTSGGYEEVVNPRTGRREFVFSKEIDRLQNEIQALEDNYQAVFERP